MAEKGSHGKINSGSYKVSKSGSVRQAGEMPSGDNSSSRGATARAGTLGSNKGDGTNSRGHWYDSYQSGGLGKMAQKFKPTTKGGKVRGGG